MLVHIVSITRDSRADLVLGNPLANMNATGYPRSKQPIEVKEDIQNVLM
jgi:hypothetical protein